jgi:prephenate dehydrogenase
LKHRGLLKGKTIIEQGSLKEWIYEDERLRDLDIRSMHILFRPSQTPNFEDRKVGLFVGQFDDEMAKDVEAITQSEIVWYKDAKEHDKEMAIQQALVHRMLLLMSKTLEGCSGSTFVSKKIMELGERVRNGNKDLYSWIQENKYLPEQLEEFEQAFENFDIGDYFIRV